RHEMPHLPVRDCFHRGDQVEMFCFHLIVHLLSPVQREYLANRRVKVYDTLSMEKKNVRHAL
ncbi:MAG: hypothetical protein NTV14_07570, partial [Coprothermobacterota bacterium]|nr:hypothetical protein [Coprothermobacterota bacterium]